MTHFALPGVPLDAPVKSGSYSTKIFLNIKGGLYYWHFGGGRRRD